MTNFRERLLRSIVEGHLLATKTPAAREREVRSRVKQAARTLFGKDELKQREQNDAAALAYLARQYIKDRACDPRTGKRVRTLKPRSLRTLAMEAATLSYGNSRSAIADRLRSQFRGREMEILLAHAVYDDDVEDTVAQKTLEQIAKLVEPYNIKMDVSLPSAYPPDRPKRTATLSSSLKVIRRRQPDAKAAK